MVINLNLHWHSKSSCLMFLSTALPEILLELQLLSINEKFKDINT